MGCVNTYFADLRRVRVLDSFFFFTFFRAGFPPTVTGGLIIA